MDPAAGFLLCSTKPTQVPEPGTEFRFDLCERIGCLRPAELADNIERKGAEIMEVFRRFERRILAERISIENGCFFFLVTAEKRR